jgi:chorismate mutase
MSGREGEPDPREELAACRAAIEAVDQQLVALLAERVALGRRTSGLKRAAGLPILDPQREAAVIRRAMEAARSHGLPEESVREIFWQVIGLSRRVQEEAP